VCGAGRAGVMATSCDTFRNSGTCSRPLLTIAPNGCCCHLHPVVSTDSSKRADACGDALPCDNRRRLLLLLLPPLSQAARWTATISSVHQRRVTGA
jgi:hypothetical protein